MHTCERHPQRHLPDGRTCDACRIEAEFRLQRRQQAFETIDELTAEQYAAWDRWLIKSVAGVLLLTLLFGIWMASVNRGMAEKYEKDRIEGRR